MLGLFQTPVPPETRNPDGLSGAPIPHEKRVKNLVFAIFLMFGRAGARGSQTTSYIIP